MEGRAHKTDEKFTGRTDTLKRVVFEDAKVPSSLSKTASEKLSVKPGDYVALKITSASHSTLVGELIARTSLQEYNNCNAARLTSLVSTFMHPGQCDLTVAS